jgi:hypothetical protein
MYSLVLCIPSTWGESHTLALSLHLVESNACKMLSFINVLHCALTAAKESTARIPSVFNYPRLRFTKHELRTSTAV